jgi:hypothetical protein
MKLSSLSCIATALLGLTDVLLAADGWDNMNPDGAAVEMASFAEHPASAPEADEVCDSTVNGRQLMADKARRSLQAHGYTVEEGVMGFNMTSTFYAAGNPSSGCVRRRRFDREPRPEFSTRRSRYTSSPPTALPPPRSLAWGSGEVAAPRALYAARQPDAMKNVGSQFSRRSAADRPSADTALSSSTRRRRSSACRATR